MKYYKIIYHKTRNLIDSKVLKSKSGTPEEAIKKSGLKEIEDVLDATEEDYQKYRIEQHELKIQRANFKNKNEKLLI